MSDGCLLQCTAVRGSYSHGRGLLAVGYFVFSCKAQVGVISWRREEHLGWVSLSVIIPNVYFTHHICMGGIPNGENGAGP